MTEGSVSPPAESAEAAPSQTRERHLPDWAVDRIDRADVDTLERWFSRALDATALQDVFQDDESTQE